MATYLIADMHFGADRLARQRGFANAAAMDCTISERWCASVAADDEVWVVGDVGDPGPLSSLPGVKHLVLGNTDTPLSAYRNCGCFESIWKCAELESSAGPLILIHRPQDADPNDPRAVAHGHIHTKTWGDPRFVCVSVDQTGWGPIALEEVVARLERAA